VPTVKFYSYSYIVVVTIGLEPEEKGRVIAVTVLRTRAMFYILLFVITVPVIAGGAKPFNRPLNYTIQQTLRLKCHRNTQNLTAYLSCSCRFCSTAHIEGDFITRTKFV